MVAVGGGGVTLSAKPKTKRPPKALSAIPGLEVRAGKPVYVGQTVFKELSLTPAQKWLVQQGMEHVLAEKCTVGILTQLVFPENLVLKQMFLDLVAYKMVN